MPLDPLAPLLDKGAEWMDEVQSAVNKRDARIAALEVHLTASEDALERSVTKLVAAETAATQTSDANIRAEGMETKLAEITAQLAEDNQKVAQLNKANSDLQKQIDANAADLLAYEALKSQLKALNIPS